MGSILLCLVMGLIAPGTLDLYHSLLTTTLAAVVFAAVYAYRSNLANIFITLGLFVGSLIFLPTTDYIFNSILKEHQQNRILSFLGIISDPLGTDYNVNQAKIAIGSGGFSGKGWMEGTQAHLDFIPERTSDFLFAVFSEEFGFVGNLVLLALYTALIGRSFYIAAFAETRFSRLLAGAIGCIFFTYTFVNMGMVSGILPVVGVPLPFMSYGGTALLILGVCTGILLSVSAESKH